MFRRGYLTLFKLRGVPVRAHWSIPLLALFVSGFSYAPGIWLGAVLVIIWHEIGHLFFVLRFGLQALSVEVSGFGGLCKYAGYPSPVESSIIAWGGVIFQVALFIVTLLVTQLVYAPTSVFGSQLADTFIRLNLALAAFNLIPIAPFDGSEAWKLFARLKTRGPKTKKSKKTKKTKKTKKASGPKGRRSDKAGSAQGNVVRLERRPDGREVLVFDEEIDKQARETVQEALERAAREARDNKPN
ncbi:MAG: hypothetical protein DRJ42_10795 [Deltaproteobacteria bacterium]|nr:MAG: hypothetical protein DRJ42_10795 [Deltaproteobacteria bacterium]